MKKAILFLFVLIGGCLALNAQKMTESVYLKNGSIIKGVIIEQVPNESLKIKTADGSLFVYQIDEVLKITKDYPTSLDNKLSGRSKGYRGFVDLGFTPGVGDLATNRLEFSTSHGYQFNPYVYLGIGAGLHYYYEGGDAFVIPIFVNPRVNFLDTNITPFIDLKLGYSVVDAEGFYFNPNIGVSFKTQERKTINVSIGYTMQKVKYNSYYDYSYYGGYSYYSSGSVDVNGISIKVGYEF